MVYHVKYVTGENVYLDAGSADSLAVGDRLTIIHGDSVIAELEIAFVAEHSSSCKITSAGGEIKIGDPAQPVKKITQPQPLPTTQATQDTVKQSAPMPVEAPRPAARSPLARVDGSVALQINGYNDRSQSNLDFTQPGARVNLRASRLFGRDITLRILSDSRYNIRSRAYSAAVPKNEWRNRFYQFSISYADERSPYHIQAGRIISSNFSGIGYIDGLLAQRNFGDKFRMGGFGGTQPQWQYSGFQTSLQKYGAFGTVNIGDFERNRLESTVAVAGEYHGPTVSREFVFLRNSLALGRIWNFYQSSEIDLNRDWRKIKTGQSLSMTNLYLSIRGRLSGWLQTGLSFDSRKNYWTFESRSVADSLFDSVLRRGLRGDINLRASRTLSIFTNFGYNKRATDRRATFSGGAGINKSNFIRAGQFINIQGAGFSSPFTNGINGSITLGRYLWKSNLVSVAYGAYNYGFSGANRFNQWFQGNGQFNLIGRSYLRGTFEYDTGDDTNGNRVIGEIGYRF